jgi:hypothetical protein
MIQSKPHVRKPRHLQQRAKGNDRLRHARYVQKEGVNGNDAMAYPTAAILIAGTQETSVFSQIEHQALVYCIWWCAGNAQLLGCHKTMYHSPAAAVERWKNQAGRAHQGCGGQGMQQMSRHCCCSNKGMLSRHGRASVQSQVEHQQLAPCIGCWAAKVEHGCTRRLSQGPWQSPAPSHLLHLLLLWIIRR